MAGNPCKWIHHALDAVGIKAFPRDAGSEPSFPYAVYTQASRTPVITLDPQPAKLPFSTDVSIAIWATTYVEAWALAQRARKALNGWQGTYQDVEIFHCILQAEADGAIDYENGGDKPVYSVEQTYLVTWPD